MIGTTIAAVMIGLFMALSQIFVDVSFAQVLTLLFVVLFLQFRPQGVIAIRSRALDAAEGARMTKLPLTAIAGLAALCFAVAAPWLRTGYDLNLFGHFLALAQIGRA